MNRRYVLPLIAVLCLSVLPACASQPDIAAEEEAIKEVIHAQLRAVENLSYDGETAVWAHTSYIERQGVTGWDSVSMSYKEFFGGLQAGDTVNEFTASNFDIHVNGTFASVFHDEHVDYVIDGEHYVGDRRPHKFLEKIDGEWKVIALF